MDTGAPRTQTGFFDLPAELRYMIYDHCLPEGGKIKVIGQRCADLESLSNAHPRLALEVKERAEENCAVLRYTVGWERWEAPLATTYRNLRRIDLMIGSYDEHTGEEYLNIDNFHLLSGEKRNCRVDQMKQNLQEFVKWIGASQTRLETLTVAFEDHDEVNHCWLKSAYFKVADPSETDPLQGHSLQTVDRAGHTVTVLEELLLPLCRLPVLENAWIFGLDLVSEWSKARSRDLEILYDYEYMATMIDALVDWLEGRRDVPIFAQWNHNWQETRVRADPMVSAGWVQYMQARC